MTSVDSSQSVDEYSSHALIEIRLLAADRLTNEGDRVEDFPGRDVITCVPAVYRSGEQCVERWFEPVQKALWEAFVGRIAGVERRGEPAFGADEVGEAPDPGYERVPRIERGP
jgi:hypothetical protein